MFVYLSHGLDFFQDQIWNSQIQKVLNIIKNYLPEELSKIEKLSDDLKFNFNTFLDKNFIDFEKVASLKSNFKMSIDKISKVYS